MTFKSWLMMQSKRKDSIGDLARTVIEDRAWPPTQDLGKLRQHMVKRGAAEKTRASLDQAYAEYQKQGNRQRPSGIG